MLLLACSTTLILAQNGSDLFQQGLEQERGKGDIAAAIKIYERIVKDFPSNRALAQTGCANDRIEEPRYTIQWAPVRWLNDPFTTHPPPPEAPQLPQLGLS
jgi:hypothetical protein